jgi:ribosomal protein S18 acetylase RimI-like enzyme
MQAAFGPDQIGMALEGEFEFAIDEFPSNAELAALWAVTWPFPATQDFQVSLRCCLLHITARQGGQLAGFVKVASDGDMHAFLLDPTVHPDFSRQRLGTELVRRAANLAGERGAQYLHVDFLPHLRGFYAGCGFEPTDAGLMRLT